MRREVEQWIKTAESEFQTAEHDVKGERFSAAAFWCQQAVEKALKAFSLHKIRDEIPKVHSLIYLAKATEVPKQFHPFLRDLTPRFVTTRYPDVGGDLPEEIYAADNTESIMKSTKEVLEWIKTKLSADL